MDMSQSVSQTCVIKLRCPTTNGTASIFNNNNNNNNKEDICAQVQNSSKITSCSKQHWKLNYPIICLLIVSHIAAIYGAYLGVTEARVRTMVWFFVLIQFGATGIIAGAHRLWTHRTYKAHILLRIFLMCCQTLALQYSIYEWSLTHRVHHRYSDTDADPHNAKRGFFFSHIGWVMVDPHPICEAKRKVVDTSDLRNDPVVWLQKLFYLPLLGLIFILIPVSVPIYFWNESLKVAFFFNFFRYILSVHQTSLVNSAAHIFGERIYDQRTEPTKNQITTYITMGEAYHNYHHAFPWDYSASEFAWDVNYNPQTAFIDLCAWLGLAWDRKHAAQELVEHRIRKHGNVDRIEVASRKPANVWLDTLIGVLWLFWALWVLLALKFVTNNL